MTVRTPFGGGIFGGQTHSQSPESIMTHICGVKTVIPSNPYDAKGLLIAAIEDNDPVVFLEPKRIYNGPFSGYYDRPEIGRASCRERVCQYVLISGVAVSIKKKKMSYTKLTQR